MFNIYSFIRQAFVKPKICPPPSGDVRSLERKKASQRKQYNTLNTKARRAVCTKYCRSTALRVSHLTLMLWGKVDGIHGAAMLPLHLSSPDGWVKSMFSEQVKFSRQTVDVLHFLILLASRVLPRSGAGIEFIARQSCFLELGNFLDGAHEHLCLCERGYENICK